MWGFSGRNHDGLRFCNGCLQDKPLSEFGKHARSSDGINTRCKECVNKRMKEYAKANPEKVRERARRNWWENREQKLAYGRQYRKDHPEINRSHARMQRRKRTTLKAGLPADFSLKDWQDCLEYWGYRCAVCGRPPGLWHKLSQDHWIPLSKGGGYTRNNVVPLCHGEGGCNNSKHAKQPIEWLTQKFGARKAKQILAKIEQYFDTVRERETA